MNFFTRPQAFGVWCLLLAAFLLGGGAVRAQTIDSLQRVDSNGRPAARIQFNANVRFLRQAPTTLTDLTQLSFELVSADESVLSQKVEESKRLEAADGLPGVVLTYAPLPATRSRLLSLRFGAKVLVQARQGPGPRSIDVVFLDAAGAAATVLPAPATELSERRYTVLLQVLGASEPAVRVPAEFQDYSVFSATVNVDGTAREALVMGYFRSEADAELVRQRLADRFPGARLQKVDAPAVQAAPAASPEPAPKAVTEASPAVMANADVERQAADLMAQAQAALTQQRYKDASDALNRALMLPPNSQTPQAQEWIGQAWEGMGQSDKAKLEYQLYLRLYPDGDGAQRVADRLAQLGTRGATAARPTDGLPASTDKKTGMTYSGNISQYYYGGQSKTESLVNISAGIDQNTLSRTNQSALVTSLDLSGRYQTEGSETRLVLRETNSKNFMASSHAQSVLSAAYVDYRDLGSKMAVRLGRQSAIGGSLFGLFDGVSLAVPLSPQFKLDVMGGVPANTLVTAPSQRLMGVMLEADNIAEHWGGNLSFIDQKTEGISDRKAMGMEVRYFGEGMSMYTQADYDLNFQKLNALTLQSSIQGPMDTTITMLVDNRKAPSLQLSDALISAGTTSLKTLLQLKSLAEVKELALGTAAQAKQAMISVSRALSPKWQGSVDLRFSEIGALPAVGNFQAVPATGAQYNVSLQLTGSNLYSSRDINGVNLSVLSSPTMHGTQVAYNNLTGILDNKASIEPSIRFYTQTDNTSTKTVRVSPGLRLSYKVSERASVLGETIYERSRTDGPSNHDASSSVFFYVGYRYDLF